MARKERKHNAEFIKDILSNIENQELAKSFKKIIGGSKEDGLFIRARNKNEVDENINILIENIDLLKEITKKYGVEDSLIKIISNRSNIIKKTCEELNLTYAQLGEAIGYGENSVSNASRGEVSKSMTKAIELYLKTINQEKELEKLTTLRNTLKLILD